MEAGVFGGHFRSGIAGTEGICDSNLMLSTGVHQDTWFPQPHQVRPWGTFPSCKWKMAPWCVLVGIYLTMSKTGHLPTCPETFGFPFLCTVHVLCLFSYWAVVLSVLSISRNL